VTKPFDAAACPELQAVEGAGPHVDMGELRGGASTTNEGLVDQRDRHPSGHEPKAIRAYLNGERRPGERKPARPEALEDFLEYCRRRPADDPHLWLTTLFDEVVQLGYAGSYQAFTAGVRRHELRPQYDACAAARSKDPSVMVLGLLGRWAGVESVGWLEEVLEGPVG
jgi:hypothetical protein